MESKRAGIASKDMTMQCWKNIRLDRCLEEAHRTIGLSNPSIVMADIAGFVRVVYHIVPFENIWTVERTTDMLSEKGKKAKRVIERYDVQLAKQGIGQVIGSARPTKPPSKVKALANTVVFSPSRKCT
ncbi:hypothetical protein F5H01DRAFT_373344 [Linnemannia elongata]|nr:hypothetical protein F5H01DRAFT_373344 [Linnemannia elongata]